MTSLSSITPADHESIAKLLHRSLVHWYETRLNQGARFGDSPAPFLLFPEVYEALDPEQALIAREDTTGDLLGVCFAHERETHLAIGIVATAPEATGRGIARQLMEVILQRAQQAGKPARLVSSLLNLDSFSLYNRLGFVPGTLFQDLLISVPASGLPGPPPVGIDQVRAAAADEAGRIADLEYSLQHIRREKDFAFFLANQVGAWRVLVAESAPSSLTGYLAMSTHPSFTMIGPGVAIDEPTAAALLWRALDSLRGQTLVFLLPSAATQLVRTAYSWGARNVELHVAQSTAPFPATSGIVFPTFMPETA
jgi:GNAT superfamily N-acetyltransferase